MSVQSGLVSAFAVVSALSIADSLYNDKYSTVSEYGRFWTNRTFTFTSPGPYFYNITGELYAGTNATGQKPIVYGAERNWGAAGGNTSKPSILMMSSNIENCGIDYSGSVTIDTMNVDTGTYIVTYDGITKDYRAVVAGYFVYK